MATGLEIGRLSERSRAGDLAGHAELIRLAKLDGWVYDRRTGTLYRNGRRTAVRGGWQGLADWIYVGLVRLEIETGRGE